MLIYLRVWKTLKTALGHYVREGNHDTYGYIRSQTTKFPGIPRSANIVQMFMTL